MCEICDIVSQYEAPKLFSDDEKNKAIDGVFSGHYAIHSLPYFIYKKTAEAFTKAIDRGFGKEKLNADELMAKDLTENVYFFSGAKTYQQVKDINDAMFDSKGNRKLFSEFKKDADKIFTDYNENYFNTEYVDAIAQSRMASKWQDIVKQASELPFLQYVTAHDARVRPEHQALEGIIRRVDDAFWKTYYPPNGWRCRCTVIQLANAVETDLSNFKHPEDVPPDFMMNSGIDRIIFPKSHPYFQVTGDDRMFARRNFDLPLPWAPTEYEIRKGNIHPIK